MSPPETTRTPFSDALEARRTLIERSLRESGNSREQFRQAEKSIRDIQQIAADKLTVPEGRHLSLVIDQFLLGLRVFTTVQIKEPEKPTSPTLSTKKSSLIEWIPGLSGVQQLVKRLLGMFRLLDHIVAVLKQVLSPTNLVQIVIRLILYIALFQCVMLVAPLANILVLLPCTLIAALILLDIVRACSASSTALSLPDGNGEAPLTLVCRVADLLATLADFFAGLDRMLAPESKPESQDNLPSLNQLKPLQQLLGFANRRNSDSELADLTRQLVEESLLHAGARSDFNLTDEGWVIQRTSSSTLVLEPAIRENNSERTLLKGRAEVSDK